MCEYKGFYMKYIVFTVKIQFVQYYYSDFIGIVELQKVNLAKKLREE